MTQRTRPVRVRFLSALERAARRRPGARRVETLLRTIADTEFDDATTLLRLHEALLLLRAYPHSPAVLAESERLLRAFGKRVRCLKRAGKDVSALESVEASGIAQTAVEMIYTFDYARWLRARFPRALAVDWDGYESGDRLGAALARFIPLVEEEFTEANVRYQDWVAAAHQRGQRDLDWLLGHISALPLSAREQAAAYDALGIWVRWELGEGWATRTRMRRRCPRPFCEDTPLITRRRVSLAKELSDAPLPVRTLSRKEGEAALDLCRAAMGTRYRELYAFTYGDPASIISANAGRGLELLVIGIVPERRLPVRAGFGAAFFRNGVLIGYGDAFGFFERLEVSFNIFPAFRDGESALVYARLLRLYRQLFGSTVFSVDPFQIGLGNHEAIASGAFWFYRKLGFRCANRAIEALARREEHRVASDAGYRTAPRTLERLAASGMVFEVPGADSREWDGFHVRNLGFAAMRRMAASSLDVDTSRNRVESRLARTLEIAPSRESQPFRRAFSGLAPVLDLVPDLPDWSRAEKQRLLAAIRAKGGPHEARYLAALQRLPRLRASLLECGSADRVGADRPGTSP